MKITSTLGAYRVPNSSLSTLDIEHFLLQTLYLTPYSLDILHTSIFLMNETLIIYCCLSILIGLLNSLQKSELSCEFIKLSYQIIACVDITIFL